MISTEILLPGSRLLPAPGDPGGPAPGVPARLSLHHVIRPYWNAASAPSRFDDIGLQAFDEPQDIPSFPGRDSELVERRLHVPMKTSQSRALMPMPLWDVVISRPV